jgi:orotate phosphoribosyltransferase
MGNIATSEATRARQILDATCAVVTGGHFVYTSGRHGSVYVNKDAVYPHTSAVSELCAMLADRLTGANVEVVCGPALGGIILSQWTAHHLGVLGVYAEAAETTGVEDTRHGLVLRRGYDTIVAGKRVAIVEDILNTGLSARRAVAAVRAAGGDAVACAALCNRGGIKASDLGVPVLHALVEIDAQAWPADSCPLCAGGVPIDTRLGKGGRMRRPS